MRMNHMNNERQTLRYWLLWAMTGWVLAGAVIYLSLTPEPPEFPGPLHWDKLDHLAAYAVLMAWFAQLYRTPRMHAFLAGAFILLGAGLEFLQHATGYRTLDIADMTANTLGVLLAWGLARTRFALALQFVERKLLPAT